MDPAATRFVRGREPFARLADCPSPALNFESLPEGAPAYGVMDAWDGVLLFGRPGHGAAFAALAAQELNASGDDFAVILLTDAAERCDRLFVAPASERKSFDPR